MAVNLSQDWPAYVLLGAVVFFYIYVAIKGNQWDKEKKDGKSLDKGNK